MSAHGIHVNFTHAEDIADPAADRAGMKHRRPLSRGKRWRGPQRFKNDLLYLLMRIGAVALQHLPLRGFIRLVGCASPYIFRREARRAEAQLRRTLPNLDAPKVTRRMFVHFAESLWELTRFRQSVPPLYGAPRKVVEEALAEGKGAIVISGHVGNWEMLGQAVAAAGFPVTTIATPFYDPRLTRWMNEWRTQLGLKILWREGNSGKAILRVLRQNELMGFLIDQNTKTAGDYVPFFGRPAFTPTIPAAISLRTGAPVIFCWHQRLTERLEAVIRQAPEQWVWMHRRWRSKRGLLLAASGPSRYP